jgi:hypothetical protein
MEKRSILRTIQRRNVKWIRHLLRRNCLFEVKIEGMGRWGKRRKQLLDKVKGEKKILKFERWSTRCFSVKNSLRKRLWTCHQMDWITYIEKSVGEIPTRQNAVFSAVCYLEKSLHLHTIYRAESCGKLGLVEEDSTKFQKHHAPPKRWLLFLYNKTNRRTDFPNLFWLKKWTSTCFGQFLCPSPGVR